MNAKLLINKLKNVRNVKNFGILIKMESAGDNK